MTFRPLTQASDQQPQAFQPTVPKRKTGEWRQALASLGPAVIPSASGLVSSGKVSSVWPAGTTTQSAAVHCASLACTHPALQAMSLFLLRLNPQILQPQTFSRGSFKNFEIFIYSPTCLDFMATALKPELEHLKLSPSTWASCSGLGRSAVTSKFIIEALEAEGKNPSQPCSNAPTPLEMFHERV